MIASSELGFGESFALASKLRSCLPLSRDVGSFAWFEVMDETCPGTETNFDNNWSCRSAEP
jgi:hypothetical protein